MEKEKIDVINKLNAIDDVFARTGKADNKENLSAKYLAFLIHDVDKDKIEYVWEK